MVKDSVYAQLSDAVYLTDPVDEAAMVSSVGFRVVRRFNHHEAQASIYQSIEEPSLYVIACRGTEFKRSWVDIFRNIGVPVNWGGPGKFHSGYLRTSRMLRPGLFDFITINKNARYKFVGHSQGGGVATVLYALVKNRVIRPADIECITFGAPPAVAGELVESLHVRRYYHENDFAPKLFLLHLSGLKHPERQSHVLPKVGSFPRSLKAHWIENYIKTLKEKGA